MDWVKILEITSVGLNFIFLFLLIRESKWCWFFGLFGSLGSAVVMYHSQYFSESILYIFYVAMAVWGWYTWNQKNIELKIKKLPLKLSFIWVLVGVLFSGILGKIMHDFTQADKPYYDAFSTIFGIIATFLEIYKYIVAWVFWIALNVYTIWLYGTKNLDFLTFQMVIYSIFSIYGWRAWSHQYIKSNI